MRAGFLGSWRESFSGNNFPGAFLHRCVEETVVRQFAQSSWVRCANCLWGILSLFLSVLTTAAALPTTYVPSTIATPPLAAREFRAAWVATVANIDWPSKPGLPVAQQKAELLVILDRAVKLNLNALIFQVRPICDALYDSKIEPWSYYLTGTMGKAPWPFYDPLAFAVEEAHKRGIELHAWFSPYRAGPPVGKFPISADHFSRTHPHLVRKYGTLLWLDPGEKEVQDYSLSVIKDVLRRYDIDGVTFDDRLGYPTENDGQKRRIDFPDDTTYRRYLAGGGRLGRDDWRRENVDTFVHRVHEAIKAEKPWVKFGIAPAGIWQPGYPPPIKGQNAYSTLYTDSRKWLMNGWLDYCSPQLYWAIGETNHWFPVLLKWWLEQNPKHRHVWPALDLDKVADPGHNWKAEEIINQINLIREQCGGTPGAAHYSAKCLIEDRGGIATALGRSVYAKPALMPASPWLESKFPDKPMFKVEHGKLKWETVGMEKVSVWVLQIKTEGQWQTRILAGDARSQSLTGAPEAVALTAIDRCGVASPTAVLERAKSLKNSVQPQINADGRR